MKVGVILSEAKDLQFSFAATYRGLQN